MSLALSSTRSTRQFTQLRRGRFRRVVVLVAICVALVVGTIGSAAAAPTSGPPRGLKAITAMASKQSELRQLPARHTAAGKAKASTNVKALDAAAATGTPTQNMGNPADKTVLPQDKLSIAKTTDGTGAGGNGTTQQAAAVNASLTGGDLSKTTADVPEGVRAIIDHQYSTAGGRFVNGASESALAFRDTAAGSDGLWQLGSISQTAEQFGIGAADSSPKLGTTYVLTQGNFAITNSSATSSAPLGSPIASDPIAGKPTNAQQWALVDGTMGDGSFQLRSRADGLCLSWVEDTKAVTADACDGNQNSLWFMYGLASGVAFFPRADGTGAADQGVGSSNGPGVAGPLVVGTGQAWSWQPLSEPGGSVPTWSTLRTSGGAAGNTTAPYDMVAADLDGAVGSDGLYHDEAVVGYTDSDDIWALRVIDYNANASRLLVTAPASSVPFGKNGNFQNGTWYPGSLIVQVGDFDGDGKNEILAGFQNGDGDLTLSFWRYVANDDGSRSLNLVNTDNCNSCDGQPFKGIGEAQTLVSGYTDTAAGDFDGDGAVDLAVAYASSSKGVFDSTHLVPNLGVVTFTSTLAIASVEVTQPKIEHYLPLALHGDSTRTGAGLQLQAGMFDLDPDNGFGYQRRELAMSWISVDYQNEDICPGSTTATCDFYTRLPQFQFYAVTPLDKCTSGPSYSTCTSTAAMSSKQPDPASVYPQNSQSSDWVSKSSPQPDVQPLAMTAGAYGGGSSDDPPAWGLWFLSWRRAGDSTQKAQVATSIVVPWKDADDPDTVVINDSYIDDASEQPVYYAVTAYDRFGDSMILGAPVVLDIENAKRLEMLAGQPPKFGDYLSGRMVNATLSPSYWLSTTSSSGTKWSSSVSTKNAWSKGGSGKDSVKATYAQKLGPFDANSSASLTEKFKLVWSGSKTTSTESSGSQSWEIGSKAIDDDSVQSSTSNARVYRYPVLGNLAGGTTCDGSPCYPYYEVTIPGSTVWTSGDGMADPDYSASWTNDNALSYPVLNADGTVPLSDEGTYSYTDTNGQTQTTSTPLLNQATALGGQTSSVTLALDQSTGGGTTTTTGHNGTSDTEVNLSSAISVGVPDVNKATFNFSVTAGYQEAKSVLTTTTTENSTTTGTDFQLGVGEVSSDRAYQIGTAVYYSDAGTPKVVHGVNLNDDQYGTFFTDAAYGTTSDVALNLPGRMVIDKDIDDNAEAPYLSVSQARQLVRGFQTVQVDSSSSILPTAGTPFASNPTSGTRMQFTVPVMNLSLVPMPAATTAHFFAVPVDAANNTVTGTKIDIGTAPVAALGAQDHETVASPIWTAPSVSDTQRYRIFVALDENGDMSEVHPLDGTACDVSVLDPDASVAPVLYDLTSTAQDPDPTGCGQNNQGYGLVSISPAASAADGVEHGTRDKPANVTLDGAGLLDGTKAHLKLGSSDPVPTVPLDANLTGLVYAKADTHSLDNQPVLVYDGDPSKGSLIYYGRMPGTSPKSGGAATFTWTPTTPGLHELHTVLLGSSTTGQDDEQILRVWVDSEPVTRPFTVTGAADQATVQVGGSAVISGIVTPTLKTPADRDIALQVKKGDSWSTVAEKDTTADGRYTFTVPEPDAGTFTYRVKKFAAGGRSVAYSPEITITVVKGFVVTAGAATLDLDSGRSTAITGTALPAQKATADRTVQLQVKSRTGWTKVASGVTTATGAYNFTVKPVLGSHTYRVVKQATSSQRAAASPAVTISVSRPFTVSAKVKPTKITKGHRATVTGTVRPPIATAKERVVQLQRKSGSSWRTIAAATTKASGSYSFTTKATKSGTQRYRVVKTATPGKRAVHSRIVVIKVRR